MIYRRNLIDLIASVVNSMTFSVTINSQVTNADGSITLSVCDIYHAEPLRDVTIGGNPYTIVSIDDIANTITVTGTIPITATSFNLYTPYFFSESPINIDNTLKSVPNANDKFPMVYMLLNYKEKYDDDVFKELNVERTSTFTLYFLTQANFAKWLIGDFLTNAVKPMERLQQNFIKALQSDIKRFNMVDATSNGGLDPRFGVFITNKGVAESYTADQLSGFHIDFTLDIYRDTTCPC